MYRVLKFGGTSVASTEKLNNIASYIKNNKGSDKIVVVVSAMNKLTDELITMATNVNSNPYGRELDRLLSTGEQQTISLLSLALIQNDIEAISLTAVQLNIKTDASFNNAKIQSLDNEILLKYFEKYDVLVVAGFQGVNDQGDVTTLGRGGSDTTAVAIASALDCSCEIYTDVEGIYATDPRIFKNAKKLDYITFDEMSELASLGAGVMHNRSINLAKKYNTTIYVAKSMSKEKGTYIMNTVNEENVVSAISLDEDIINFTICSKDKQMMESFLNNDINVDMVSQVSHNGTNLTAFSTSSSNLDAVIQLIDEDDITINKNLSKISLVGLGMRDASGVMAKIYRVLNENSISIVQTSTSEITISILVNKNDTKMAIEKLCIEFDLEER